jgi:hypothetical protein
MPGEIGGFLVISLYVREYLTLSGKEDVSESLGCLCSEFSELPVVSKDVRRSLDMPGDCLLDL